MIPTTFRGCDSHLMRGSSEGSSGSRGDGPWPRSSYRLNQPPGVPPLPLTGERTLPDVPEENYWFRRHLVVYEWIAERVAGQAGGRHGLRRGLRLRRARRQRRRASSASTPTPRRTSTRGCATSAPNLRFERDLVESFAEPCDAVVFLQTIEHVQDPGAILEHFKSMLAPGGVAYVSTPNLLTLAPPGAEKSDNPWHVKEYRAEEFRELCEAHFDRVELLGLFHARKLRAHELAIKLGWDSVHKRLGLTKPFYDRFTPAIAASDFTPARRGTSTAPSTSSPSAVPDRMARSRAAESAGDLAIVLHSHMPYVEGFGTYPFGEEWLFDAVIRSYLPVLEVARDLTMTVTPVLADQLEDAGAAERLRRFLVEWRIGAAEADLPRGRRRSAAPPAKASASATATRWSCSTRPAAIRCALSAGGRGGAGRARRLLGHPRGAAAAGDAAGLRLQLDAGIRSHRRRFGWDGGFWLPECAYEPGLEWELARAGGALVLRRPERRTQEPLDALAPVRTEAGPVALPIDWEAIAWLWSLDGYPSDPAHAQFAGKSLRGIRHLAGRRRRLRPGRRRGRRAAPGGGVPRRDRRAPARPTPRSAAVAACSSSRSTPSCSATGGRRGRSGCGRCWRGRRPRGSACSPSRRRWPSTSRSSGRCAPRPGARARTCGTWDSPPVADLAWGARRLELRLLRALSRRAARRGAPTRAARELLAAQASDWAFLDQRDQAGDYAYQRATDHSQALLEAIDSGRATDPRMRSLAPDLSVAPLLEP